MDIALGATIDLKFVTRAGGVPFALSGGTVVAYPDNSLTEITAGITLSADFDSRTGLNNVRVEATSGNGYVTGTKYTLVLSAGTVDGVSVVGMPAGEFTIEAESALRPATAGRTLVVDAAGLADANAVKVGPSGSGTAQTAGNLQALIAALFTTAMSESYAADGVAPTPAQALFLIQQRLTEFAIVATTITINKIDGTTPAATLTIDSATAPTSSTRAT